MLYYGLYLRIPASSESPTQLHYRGGNRGSLLVPLDQHGSLSPRGYALVTKGVQIARQSGAFSLLDTTDALPGLRMRHARRPATQGHTARHDPARAACRWLNPPEARPGRRSVTAWAETAKTDITRSPELDLPRVLQGVFPKLPP
jgi:hypothetical protein